VQELFENEHVRLLFLFKVSLFGTCKSIAPAAGTEAARRELRKPDSEELRSAPRTLLASGGTLQDSPQPFQAERRGNMVSDRAYSPGLLPSSDRRVSLLYFAAAVPAVGFVHGPADLYPLHATTLASYADGDFVLMEHGRKIDSLAS
jgi:hypothetical protein